MAKLYGPIQLLDNKYYMPKFKLPCHDNVVSVDLMNNWSLGPTQQTNQRYCQINNLQRIGEHGQIYQK